ncbi:MAG: PCI domain-containing protein [Candidatus Thorarchaeota archaeon]
MRENYLVWFISNSILGVLFILWGSLAPSMPLIPGDIWLLVPGSIMLLLGIVGILENIIFENKLKKLFKEIPAEGITLTELAEKMNLEVDNLRDLLFSLRSQGKLQVIFNSQNGVLISSSTIADETCKKCGALMNNAPFCTVCGNKQH